MSGVQVLSDSHPRQGGMDEDERDQCIHDVVSWFQRKAKLKNSTAKSSVVGNGASRGTAKFAEEAKWRDLVRRVQGAVRPTPCVERIATTDRPLFVYRALCLAQSISVDDIASTAETLSGVKGWKSSFIPFATNVDGAALISDVGSRNAVFEFGNDGKGDQLAPTLLQYLEEYRNRLLSGQFDYVEDVGLVERSRK